jgi:hypothetical protein
MQRRSARAAILGLLFAASYFAGANAGGVPGTKERITFEGLVGRHEQEPIPDYDGFGWFFWAVGKGLHKDALGFQSVLRGKAAAANLDGNGAMGRDDGGLFSVKSGHFAAFGNESVQVTFNAYRQGVLVGTKSVLLQPNDVLVQFDRTFAKIDEFDVSGGTIAMDNLHVAF